MKTATPISEASLMMPARMLGALADPARLRILNLIKHGGEVCNCQIGPVTDFIPSKISRHLSILKQAGLLTERRAGTFIHYQLAPQDDGLRRQLFMLLEVVAAEDPCLRDDRMRLDRHRCCA